MPEWESPHSKCSVEDMTKREWDYRRAAAQRCNSRTERNPRKIRIDCRGRPQHDLTSPIGRMAPVRAGVALPFR
jgi:hypothetical protein